MPEAACVAAETPGARRRPRPTRAHRLPLLSRLLGFGDCPSPGASYACPGFRANVSADFPDQETALAVLRPPADCAARRNASCTSTSTQPHGSQVSPLASFGCRGRQGLRSGRHAEGHLRQRHLFRRQPCPQRHAADGFGGHRGGPELRREMPWLADRENAGGNADPSPAARAATISSPACCSPPWPTLRRRTPAPRTGCPRCPTCDGITSRRASASMPSPANRVPVRRSRPSAPRAFAVERDPRVARRAGRLRVGAREDRGVDPGQLQHRLGHASTSPTTTPGEIQQSAVEMT